MKGDLPKCARDFALSLHKVDFLENLFFAIPAVLVFAFLLIVELAAVLGV